MKGILYLTNETLREIRLKVIGIDVGPIPLCGLCSYPSRRGGFPCRSPPGASLKENSLHSRQFWNPPTSCRVPLFIYIINQLWYIRNYNHCKTDKGTWKETCTWNGEMVRILLQTGDLNNGHHPPAYRPNQSARGRYANAKWNSGNELPQGFRGMVYKSEWRIFAETTHVPRLIMVFRKVNLLSDMLLEYNAPHYYLQNRAHWKRKMAR